MTNDTLSAVVTIDAPAPTVFGMLTDPAWHTAIDRTGWVREPLDDQQLTEAVTSRAISSSVVRSGVTTLPRSASPN
jgi:hypothetical protein